MDFQEVGRVYSLDRSGLGKDRWLAVVNAVTNNCVSYNLGKFLTS
jgi:hypothetical protein